ncbi:hypothetical protein EDD80_12418 [Anseongella ginsenosidimutans]|uniref:Uncharacterized protein n=1 Tax=Anseongella ginsenosidimutans TaxID=496056 RepID=A0A4R3KJL8_9SPHI|nr:hypothetical protein [Anseongella ginsenosidimutans]QEC53616.1 hypothetical protein FRZ59_15585 [Anseongella ginsenosidimutans]TCS83961.1 hypothetical protein EDD80_12418 [Anseongella ginsenosidimutans]
MKFKLTPLFLLSSGLILYGLYMLIFHVGGNGLGGLVPFLLGGAGAIGLFIYAVFRVTLAKRVWVQVGIESLVILGILYFGYKKVGFYEFRLPHDYRGHVVLVYGVDHAPALKTPFYSNKIKMVVPPSGVLLTSSLPNDNYSDPAVFLDSTLGEIQDLPKPFKRQSAPVLTDTLRCGNRKYLMDQWLIKEGSYWSLKDDTVFGLDRKLLRACTLISE